MLTFKTILYYLLEPRICYFEIGYGAFMAPSGLAIISREKYEAKKNRSILGGAVGMIDGDCPKDAKAADDLIQNMNAETKNGIFSFLYISIRKCAKFHYRTVKSIAILA